MRNYFNLHSKCLTTSHMQKKITVKCSICARGDTTNTTIPYTIKNIGMEKPLCCRIFPELKLRMKMLVGYTVTESPILTQKQVSLQMTLVSTKQITCRW